MRNEASKPQIALGPEAPRSMAWGVLAGVWLLLLVIFRAHVALIVEAWETLPSHAHGYVVLAVVAYFAWKKRQALACIRLAPAWEGLAFMALAGLAAFAGELVSAGVVVQFSLVFMLQGAVWAILGWQAFRLLLGPLSFLLFAIPFGHDILPTLMDWTANATVVGLRASGVPVFQQDRNFVIPSGSWSVIEACSGIRYLLTSIFVGAIFAYMTYSKWHKRVLFMFWMLVLPLLANWLRAYTIVMVAHLSDNQWGLGLSHLALGWVVFAITVLGSFYIGGRWQDPEYPVSGIPDVRGVAPGRLGAVAAACLVIALAAEHGNSQFDTAHPGLAPVLELAKFKAGLESSSAKAPPVAPRFVGAAVIHRGTYRQGDGEITLSVAYYRNQKQGQELVNVQNVIEPSEHWAWRSSGRMVRPVEGVADLRLETYALGDGRAVAALLYWVGGRTTTSDVVAKLYQALNVVTGRGDDAARVVLVATDQADGELAKARLSAFVRQHLPLLLEDLESTRRAPIQN